MTLHVEKGSVRNAALPRWAFLGLGGMLLASAGAVQAAKKCDPPAIPPTHAAPGTDMDGRWHHFQDQMNQYRDCIVAYQKAEIAEAKHHQELASGAVTQFNDFIKKVKAAQAEMKNQAK
jgi:hypothetical protein